MLGTQHGYYPDDAKLAWQADALVDFIESFVIKMSPDQRLKNLNDETLKVYCECWQKIVNKLAEVL